MSDQEKLSDAQHARLTPLPLLQSDHPKVPHRQVLDAWFHVLKQGCAQRGLPREISHWHTIYVRLYRWAKVGVLGRLAAELQGERLASMDLDTPALDSTTVKPHAHGTDAPKNKESQAIGRSRSLPQPELRAV